MSYAANSLANIKIIFNVLQREVAPMAVYFIHAGYRYGQQRNPSSPG